MNVLKHNGTLEPLQLHKFRDSLKWAMDGVKGVSLSDLEMQCQLHFYDGIPTDYILDVSIKTSYDMSSVRHIGYDTVARNLMLQKLYKQVYKSTKPYSVKQHLHLHGKHYGAAVNSYDDYELDQLNTALVHERDFTMSASGLEKTIGSDVKKVNKIPIETPQLMFMLIAMDTFRHDINRVVEVYNALSTYKITLPTPELKALRSNSTDYASCCTIRVGDNEDSWNTSDSAIVKHTMASAGVGIDIADIASLGDMVKNNTIAHSGKIPIIKSHDALIGKSSQNGRRGTGTEFVNFFDPEIEDIFALKSPRTAAEKRINDISYGIKLNQLVYDKAALNEPVSLFSVRTAPHLNSLFYGKDYNAFVAEYERLEREGLASGQVNARDFFKTFGSERFETSFYYVVNIDEVNSNTPYEEEIAQSNVCVEFLAPTKPIQSSEPHAPAIGICVLGNINQSLVYIDELPYYTRLLVELQTMLALRQNHPTPQANAFVNHYRDIGIGFSNHAHWLASHGWRYGQQEALDAHDEWMEHFAYGLISASCDLVDVFGVAPGFNQTSWSKGIMPIDRYKKTVDELTQRNATLDWDSLRKRVIKRGMVNCGLSMIPPSESSSIGSNQTSSMEPIKDLLTIKDRQGSNLKQYAPDALLLADKYDYAYDRNINKDYLKHVCVTQKWIDKGISANAWYNPEWYEDNKVALSDIISDMFFAKYYGAKTAYYNNTRVPDGQEQKQACEGGGCEV